MTIYAIVNGISSGSCPDENDTPVWSILSPSGILQGGNPFFVPDFADTFEARNALAVRIGRLGKGIARRFAHRYVDSVAPAVLFVASDLLGRLRENGLPWTRAISYDRCLALGRFFPIPADKIKDCRVRLKITDRDNQPIEDTSDSFRGPDVGEVIESLSRDNTLKTGDIILMGISGKGRIVTPGLSAKLSLNEEEALKFNIR